jgi:signal transduction histidine kinase
MLLALINDVLALSRLEAGRTEMNPKTINVLELLDRFTKEFEPVARAKSLGLVRGYGKLPSITADEDAVSSILRNLIDNAVKFTQVGAVILRGHYDENRHQVVIMTDTGPGIAPDRQDRLFDVYLQAENLLLRSEQEGTAWSRHFVPAGELNGGHLWFETVVGQGTTFYLALPAAKGCPQLGIVWAR